MLLHESKETENDGFLWSWKLGVLYLIGLFLFQDLLGNLVGKGEERERMLGLVGVEEYKRSSMDEDRELCGDFGEV